MLRDRKVLLEHDLAHLKREAANMYLSCMVSGNSPTDEYAALQSKISSLEFDLASVIILIDQGHM